MPTLPATTLWTIDFGINYDFPHALIYAAGYLWVGNQSNTGTLVRIDPNNPTAFSEFAFPNDVWHGWVSDVLYIPSKNKVYCLMGSPNVFAGYTTVTEVDPVTLAFTDVIQTSVYNVEQGSFACDGTYLYIVSRQLNNIYKYRISDWALVDSMGTGMPFAHCIRYDSGKLYVSSSGGALGSISLVEITTSSFTVTKTVVIDHDKVFTDDMAITSDYLWLGSEQTGNILRISRSNFNNQLVINTGVLARNFGVYYDGEGIWTGWEGFPGLFGRLNTSTLALQLYQFPNTNQKSPNEFLRIGSVMYFTHYHLEGSLSAMGVSGGVPTDPGNVGVTDQLFLNDSVSLSATSPPGIFILDSISFADQVSFSRTQGIPNEDTISLSDSLRVNYPGLFDFSDTLSLVDGSGVWNTTYYETLGLSDAAAYSLDLPAATDINRLVEDSYQLFDSLAYTVPNQFVSVGDFLFFDDGQPNGTRVILNSTLDGYLRRYLNDVRRSG